MAYTVAITNQKGGVGKTTTAVNLAAALAIAERRTLLVDADPQGNTTSGVGVAKLELQVSLYDVLVDDHPVHDVVLPVPGLRHLSLLPATQDLVGAELQLVERPFRESALRRVLEPLEQDYDYIVVDCPPSLGLLTLNVLAAVQQLIIPIQCEYYGLEGISQLLNTVRLVQHNINPGLAIGGVLLTMYDSRLNLCRQVAEDATEYFGPKVFGTPIPRNVRLAEAPSFGKPILLYDVQSVGAKSYLAVAQELLRRVEGTDVTIAPAQVAAAAAHASSGAAAASGSPESPASEVAPSPVSASTEGTFSGENTEELAPAPDAPREAVTPEAAVSEAVMPEAATHPVLPDDVMQQTGEREATDEALPPADHASPQPEPATAASDMSLHDPPIAPDSEPVALSESDPPVAPSSAEQAGSLDDTPSVERASAEIVSPESPAVSADSTGMPAPDGPAVIAEIHDSATAGNAEEVTPQPQATAPTESPDDEAARRSHHSSEARPEVTT